MKLQLHLSSTIIFSETFQIMIVLEYMSNGDLRDYLNKLPRPRLASSQGVPEVTPPTPQF